MATANGEESQTEILRLHFVPHLTGERYHAWNYARPQETGRPTERMAIYDLFEWTGESIPDVVRKADDRLAFRRFVYEVAHARESGTAA